MCGGQCRTLSIVSAFPKPISIAENARHVCVCICVCMRTYKYIHICAKIRYSYIHTGKWNVHKYTCMYKCIKYIRNQLLLQTNILLSDLVLPKNTWRFYWPKWSKCPPPKRERKHARKNMTETKREWARETECERSSYLYIYVYIPTFIYIHTHTYIYIYMHVYMCILHELSYVYTYMYMNICIYTYV